jgi:hypothetical protein
MALVALGKGGRESSRRGERQLEHREGRCDGLQGTCELAAAATADSTGGRAPQVWHARPSCLLPASTDRIPASSDPNHLPLVVLVRNTRQGGRAEDARAGRLLCRAGLVSCCADVDLPEMESRAPADVAYSEKAPGLLCKWTRTRRGREIVVCGQSAAGTLERQGCSPSRLSWTCRQEARPGSVQFLNFFAHHGCRLDDT